MNINTETKHAVHLTEEEKEAMSKLRMEGGYLWRDYKLYRLEKSSQVVIARRAGDIIGWGFVYQGDNKQYYQQMFVRKGLRGKGVGDAIKEAIRGIFVGSKVEINTGSRTMELGK